MENFKLVIPASVSTGNPIQVMERAFRNAVTEVLKIQEAGEAIKPFKANGKVLGHKVLDDAAAVDALIGIAPLHYHDVLATKLISTYRKTQLLNTVLSKYFEIDSKSGKLTGQPSAKHLQRLAKAVV